MAKPMQWMLDRTTNEHRKVLHYNIPQIRGAVVRARTEVLRAARRAGKTTGVIAERVSWNAFKLRRSLGGIVVPSHKKFLTSFIPSFIQGLEALGYVEERDFYIGRRGPKHWDQPYHRPKKYDHAMHWRSGSAESFISQYGGSAGAGQTLDRLVGDEAKHLDGDQFEEETLAAMSGHPAHFKDRSEHLSLLLTSDMPFDTKGKWFYKYKAKMDPEVIRTIMQLQVEIQHKWERINSGEISAASQLTYRSQVREYEQVLNQLRAKATYWHEASTIDNIHAVGPQYIKLMAEKMEMAPFMASILNMDVTYVAGGFYPDLDDSRHGYWPRASAYSASLGLDREARAKLATPDCRHDAELVPRLPLEIALDYGASFNCIATGQFHGDLFRVDNGLHVYRPQKTADLVRLWCQYYQYHPVRDVFYYYDHTAIAKDGKDDYSYADIVIKELRKHGWNVKPIYIGKQPEHHYRYEAWGDLLSEDGDPPFRVEFNLDNCEDMLISLHMCEAKQTAKGFHKNKSPERDKTLDQAHAPHYSDAVDTLILGRLLNAQGAVSMPVISGFGS